MTDRVRILKKERVYDGYFAIDQFDFQFVTYHHGWSRVIRREVFERGHAVAVLLYDRHCSKVVLIEQFRIGAIKGVNSPWLLELVAGVIEENESPVDVAKREVFEEAGIIIDRLTPITSYWATPGGSSELVYLFCGFVDATKAGGVHGLASEDEDIKVVVMDADQAFALVASGEICNATAIIGLQWLQLNQRELASL